MRCSSHILILLYANTCTMNPSQLDSCTRSYMRNDGSRLKDDDCVASLQVVARAVVARVAARVEASMEEAMVAAGMVVAKAVAGRWRQRRGQNWW